MWGQKKITMNVMLVVVGSLDRGYVIKRADDWFGENEMIKPLEE